MRLCKILHNRFMNGGTQYEANKRPADAHAQARKICRIRALRSPVYLRQHKLLLYGSSAPSTRGVGTVQ